jgi:hypothetical protein
MANIYNSNPIIIDVFNIDIDIAYEAVKVSEACIFIKGIRFHDPTGNDLIVLKNHRDNIVAMIHAETTNNDETIDVSFVSEGLRLYAADQTITTGQLFIYV